MRFHLKDVDVSGVDLVGQPANGRPFAILKSLWSTARINDLPDSSFAHIEPGGAKDDQGKTTPRSKRHLPYKNEDGEIDHNHLANALSRLDETDIPDAAKQAAKGKLAAAARKIGLQHEALDDEDTAKSLTGGPTMTLAEFKTRFSKHVGAADGATDAQLREIAKGLGITITDGAASAAAQGDDDRSLFAKFKALFAPEPPAGTVSIDKSKLSPEVAAVVTTLEAQLTKSNAALAELAAARATEGKLAIAKRAELLVKNGWLKAEDPNLATEAYVAAVEKARERFTEVLKNAGLERAFGDSHQTESEPTLRDAVHKRVVDVLGREPISKAEEAQTKVRIYRANPGLLKAVLEEERGQPAA